jgi:GNAT superfamily N-acetyltransferase
MSARIDAGEMEGYLAFDADERVAGWLNAQPRHRLPHCFARLGIEAPAIDVPTHRAAVVLCFVIDPATRRRGVARALLEHAVDDLHARGIVLVDAFPARSARTAAAHYRGPQDLFARCGFDALSAAGEHVVMRRRLS